MAYHVYLGAMMFPIPPSEIKIKIKGQNKSLTLINDEEITLLRNPGLTEISCDFLLPNVKYPSSIAQYKQTFQGAKYFLDRLEYIKTRKKIQQFIVTRELPNGKLLFDTNIPVSLENYTIKESAKQGFDVVVSVTMKQYRHYGTKTVEVSTDGTASVENSRETSNSPAPSGNSVVTHTVSDTDTLWSIAKYYYGDGSKYTAIYEANKDKISNPSAIYTGQKLIIPDSTKAAKDAKAAKTPSTPTASGNKKQHTVTFVHEGYFNKYPYAYVVVSYFNNGNFITEPLLKDKTDVGQRIPPSTDVINKVVNTSIFVDDNSELMFTIKHRGLTGDGTYKELWDISQIETIIISSYAWERMGGIFKQKITSTQKVTIKLIDTIGDAHGGK